MSPSDEEKRDTWYCGTVGKLDLPERRMSDVRPIPVGNSSPKSDNGSVAMLPSLMKRSNANDSLRESSIGYKRTTH